MPHPHDPARQHRILYEVIVDCYEEEEELMGWYYYMAEGLKFPIDVTVRFSLKNGKTEVKPAQIVNIDPKSKRGNPIRLGTTEPGSERVQHISPEELTSADTMPENLEILNDWFYWQDHPVLSGAENGLCLSGCPEKVGGPCFFLRYSLESVTWQPLK